MGAYCCEQHDQGVSLSVSVCVCVRVCARARDSEIASTCCYLDHAPGGKPDFVHFRRSLLVFSGILPQVVGL